MIGVYCDAGCSLGVKKAFLKYTKYPKHINICYRIVLLSRGETVGTSLYDGFNFACFQLTEDKPQTLFLGMRSVRGSLRR